MSLAIKGTDGAMQQTRLILCVKGTDRAMQQTRLTLCVFSNQGY